MIGEDGPIFLRVADAMADMLPLDELQSGIEQLEDALAGRRPIPWQIVPMVNASGPADEMLRGAIDIWRAAIRRRAS